MTSERRTTKRRPSDVAGSRELARFTALVALLAILSDAAVGHALLWENDPYWTYWITKTFLIATVFGLGTAWLGTGVVRGAAIADRKSTRLNSSHANISYAVFCLKKQ